MTVLDIIRAEIDAHGLTADSVVAIVREYLEDWEYDGLCNPENECGCDLDDLCSCADPDGCGVSDCVAGHRVTCAECPHREADEGDESHCPAEPTPDGYCIFAGPRETP